MSMRTMNPLRWFGNVPGYTGHTYSLENLTRRKFLTAAGATTFGLAAGLGLRLPKLVDAAPPVSSALPKPIPGGLHFLELFFGFSPPTELFHVFAPLAAPGNDPITITDFHGFIAAAEITGHGTVTPPVMTPTGPTSRLFFDNDMRFMQGHYIGVDGQEHNGTFGFF